jgi:nitrite reductase (NADH) small subunit/3-phenylpropionate/trans-cinnamate dioxygenase ferredoxin subunit
LAGFEKVGKLGEFREGRGRVVTVSGVKVAVFRVGDKLHAVRDRCPHMGASLAEGTISGGAVRCSWHGWRFDLETGDCDRKDWVELPVYEVRVEGDDVMVRVPESEPAGSEPGDDGDWFVFDE